MIQNMAMAYLPQVSISLHYITHWGRDKMADISPTTFQLKQYLEWKYVISIVSKGPINNSPALVQIMAWRPPGDKPLSEPIMVRLPTHIYVTRPQWVNSRNTPIYREMLSVILIMAHYYNRKHTWNRQQEQKRSKIRCAFNLWWAFPLWFMTTWCQYICRYGAGHSYMRDWRLQDIYNIHVYEIGSITRNFQLCVLIWYAHGTVHHRAI